MNGLIIDSFSGGGGASVGIKAAFGRTVDHAIDHNPEAIAFHQLNHPHTRHHCDSVWNINPQTITCGIPAELVWFSPDCKHFSRAKGGGTVDPSIRGLAWVVLRWASKNRPRIIMLENVKEFQDWGPLRHRKPMKERKGETFRLWVSHLQALGYQVAWKILRACDYGAPTIRERLFIVAKRDGLPIIWPKATHGQGLIPYRTAAECIDWSIPCPSIFNRKRPLAEATMLRIAKGVQRFVVDADNPFIAQDAPASISSQQQVVAYLIRHFGQSVGQQVSAPAPTTTANGGGKTGLVQAFLVKYYGTGGQWQDCRDPIHTIPTLARFGVVIVHGAPYQIVDICMRMLTPRELFRAQGFPDSYVIDQGLDGKPISKATQIRLVGNSVSPPVAEALIRANISTATERMVA